MKYSDLFENRKEEFEDDLTRDTMDILVLYQVAGANKTNINNIIDELNKLEYSVDIETITEVVEQLGFTVDGDKIVFSDDEEELELTDEDEYDEVDSMAQKATDKRLKD